MLNSYPYGDPLLSITMLSALTQQAKKSWNARPQEERDRITAEREAIQEQKRANACISQGKCPHCLGKLIRGKKDKKNGYKRTWKCLKCDKDIIN